VSTPDARYAWRQIQPLIDADPSGLLAAIVAAGTVGDRPLFQLMEDPGAAAFLDPATTPLDWLAWTARVKGAVLTRTMTEAQARAEVEHPVARDFGAPGRILAAVVPFLTGARRVVALRRTDPAHPGDDRPCDFTLVIHPADVPDGTEPMLEAAAEAQAWISLRVHFVYESGRTWADLASETAAWADAAELYETWSDAAAGT
jgi:hypothetical protein